MAASAFILMLALLVGVGASIASSVDARYQTAIAEANARAQERRTHNLVRQRAAEQAARERIAALERNVSDDRYEEEREPCANDCECYVQF